MNCILCKGATKKFWKSKNREFVECTNCGGIQLLSQFYISKKAEEARYLTHNNDVDDPKYQDFVKPITSRILKDFSTEHSGLDYGCGTGPVISIQLEKEGYKTVLYDPYFHPQTSVLTNKYNFIICCEVMEHFYKPQQEFRTLASLLKPGGKLYCKTSLYSEKIDFDNWYYKNDVTHVFFYTEKSLIWIKDNLDFSALEIHPNRIIFSK
ncbi:Methyltransferase domain-containing protein [Salegentibacter holothuriorum]|uniref:Methyltransferase domain-containing protein n=1 Tax=Salegentibacter holothuriorum TaxID=241145 RepID=A0A1T5AZE8_9FLAO|nr:class I SAM-dependent methyltransferase [Salegentibacter holothuriorum]SKB40388.1 Methyltransferase domain-containing protein [Salegentibacter holothuriorum]